VYGRMTMYVRVVTTPCRVISSVTVYPTPSGSVSGSLLAYREMEIWPAGALLPSCATRARAGMMRSDWIISDVGVKVTDPVGVLPSGASYVAVTTSSVKLTATSL
jgi:hypothetical protein